MSDFERRWLEDHELDCKQLWKHNKSILCVHPSLSATLAL